VTVPEAEEPERYALSIEAELFKHHEMLRHPKLALAFNVCSGYAVISMEHLLDNDSANEGWVTTRVAAVALGIQPRRVRNYIADGELEARTKGEGANRRYLVSISSVEALRDKRLPEGKVSEQNRGNNGAWEVPRQRELSERIEDLQRQLGRMEGHLELAQVTESTLREQLQRERERADRLEADREQLFPDLLRERDRANAERERADQFEDKLREALEARRGWLRRFFGF
jgi:hypothetical protein